MESIQLDMSHSIFVDVHNQSLMRDQEIERMSSRYETENIMITIEELGLDSSVKTNSTLNGRPNMGKEDGIPKKCWTQNWPNHVEDKQSTQGLTDVTSRGINKSFVLVMFLLSCGFLSGFVMGSILYRRGLNLQLNNLEMDKRNAELNPDKQFISSVKSHQKISSDKINLSTNISPDNRLTEDDARIDIARENKDADSTIDVMKEIGDEDVGADYTVELHEKEIELVRRGAVTGRVNDFLLRFHND